MSTKAQQMPDGKNGEAEAQDTPYWSSALSSIGIWNGSKVKTSPPGQEATEEANRSKGKASTDHLVTPFHGQSFKSYPEDCPRLKVQWFHAVDVLSPHQTAQAETDTATGVQTEHSTEFCHEGCCGGQTANQAEEILSIYFTGFKEDRVSVPKTAGSRRSAAWQGPERSCRGCNGSCQHPCAGE